MPFGEMDRIDILNGRIQRVRYNFEAGALPAAAGPAGPGAGGGGPDAAAGAAAGAPRVSASVARQQQRDYWTYLENTFTALAATSEDGTLKQCFPSSVYPSVRRERAEDLGDVGGPRWDGRGESQSFSVCWARVASGLASGRRPWASLFPAMLPELDFCGAVLFMRLLLLLMKPGRRRN
jgi:hypothetical protein